MLTPIKQITQTVLLFWILWLSLYLDKIKTGNDFDELSEWEMAVVQAMT